MIWHNSHMQVERLWCFQDNERFPRFVIIDSKKIDGAAFDRANKILEEGRATDDSTPMIFLDEKLDSPELRERIQADSINISAGNENISVGDEVFYGSLTNRDIMNDRERPRQGVA